MILPKYVDFRNTFNTSGATDVDGYLVWPVANVTQAGFNSGFTGIATPIQAFPITVSVDGSANGAVAYHAYLSQRTDVVASQFFTIDFVAGKSGTWTISLTSLGVSELGIGSSTAQVNGDHLVIALRDVTLYVQRISDDLIQYVNILKATLA